MRKEKGIVHILLLFFVAAIAIGGWWLWKKYPIIKYEYLVEQCISKGGSIGESYPPTCIYSDVEEMDYSEWVTYTNEQFGFSFQYPPELYLDLGNKTPPALLFKDQQDKPRATQTELGIVIRPNTSLDQEVKNFTESMTLILETRERQGIEGGAELLEPEEIQTNGKRAYQVKSVDEGSMQISTFMEHNNNVFNFVLISPFEYNKEYEITYNQILSTFEFTE